MRREHTFSLGLQPKSLAFGYYNTKIFAVTVNSGKHLSNGIAISLEGY